jgi:hypothetical protein
MADLAASAVTILRAWSEGGMANKDLSCRQVQLVLTGQGTSANKIPASVLGLAKIEQATLFVVSDNSKVYPAAPSADGTFLLLTNPDQATDANRANPADITGTLIGVVKGYL